MSPPEVLWTDPDLLLAQTCGLPLATRLEGRVRVVATPRYRAQGCDGVDYRSAVVVREDSAVNSLLDLRGGRCAANDLGSNSGMNLLRAEIAPLAAGKTFFKSVLVTGSHLASAEAIVQDKADVAALDCVTWAHLQRWRPSLTDQLRVLTWSVRSPGLPLITSLANQPEPTGRDTRRPRRSGGRSRVCKRFARSLLLDELQRDVGRALPRRTALAGHRRRPGLPQPGLRRGSSARSPTRPEPRRRSTGASSPGRPSRGHSRTPH
jgi:hypothetical protein